jgi:hypothetical protein
MICFGENELLPLLKKNFDQLKSDRQLRDKMLTAKSPGTITTLLLKVY